MDTGSGGVVVYDPMKRHALLLVLSILAVRAAAVDTIALAYTAPTPEARPLEEKASAFRLKMDGVGRIAKDKELALAKRRVELLTREKDKYQAAGDFDRTTAFAEALAKPGEEIASDVAELKTFYAWNRAQLAAIRKERAEGQARIAADFAAELAEWKKDLVRDGKLGLAKEVNAYEALVGGVLAACREEAGVPSEPAKEAAKPSSAVAPANAGADNGFRMPLGRDVTVYASTGQGVLLGDLNAGDIVVLQYKEGSWSDSRSAARMKIPDDPFDGPDHRMALVWNQKLRRGVGTLPAGTKQHPFAFRVAAPSTFLLRINDPNPGDNQGKATWHYTVVSAANADTFRESPEGKNCQWKFWAPGR